MGSNPTGTATDKPSASLFKGSRGFSRLRLSPLEADWTHLKFVWRCRGLPRRAGHLENVVGSQHPKAGAVVHHWDSVAIEILEYGIDESGAGTKSPTTPPSDLGDVVD